MVPAVPPNVTPVTSSSFRTDVEEIVMIDPPLGVALEIVPLNVSGLRFTTSVVSTEPVVKVMRGCPPFTPTAVTLKA